MICLVCIQGYLQVVHSAAVYNISKLLILCCYVFKVSAIRRCCSPVYTEYVQVMLASTALCTGYVQVVQKAAAAVKLSYNQDYLQFQFTLLLCAQSICKSFLLLPGYLQLLSSDTILAQLGHYPLHIRTCRKLHERLTSHVSSQKEAEGVFGRWVERGHPTADSC